MTEPTPEAEMATAILISVISRSLDGIFKDMPEDVTEKIAKTIVLAVAEEGFNLYLKHDADGG